MKLPIHSIMAFPFDFFSNPAVGLVGSVASVLGVLLALYFYRKTRHFRELVYQVNPSKAALVRAGQVSRLRTLFDDREIEADITAAQITLWNRGTTSIRTADILEPIAICLEEGISVLEASVRKTSRDVVGLFLDDSEFEKGKVGVGWKILEHNDGCIVQIIYNGIADVEITVNGIVEGQQSIRPDLDPVGRLGKANRVLRWVPAIGAVSGIFGLGVFLQVYIESVGRPFWMFALAWVLCLLMIGLGLWFHRPFQEPNRTPLD